MSTFANAFISFQGIFISRVIKGGASEKAGIHVGDRLLEVGGGIILLTLIIVVQNLLIH